IMTAARSWMAANAFTAAAFHTGKDTSSDGAASAAGRRVPLGIAATVASGKAPRKAAHRDRPNRARSVTGSISATALHRTPADHTTHQRGPQRRPVFSGPVFSTGHFRDTNFLSY